MEYEKDDIEESGKSDIDTEDAESGDNSDILEMALEDFKNFSEANQDNVDAWREDMEFARLGKQWPDEVKRQREQDGRPCLTINKLPSFIRQVTNDARQNKPAIKYHAVSDDASKDVAEIYNGLTRNIEYSSNADIAYDNALDHAVTAGFGYFRVVTEYANDDVFDQDIKIEPVKNPLTIIPDANSDSADSSDWTKCFVTEMIPRKEFDKRWPKAKAINWEENARDNPDWSTDKEIRVCEYWVVREEPAIIYQLADGSVQNEEGYVKIREYYQTIDLPAPEVKSTRDTITRTVTQYILTGKEVLETNKWPGKYIPIIPVYGDEVNLDGERTFVSLIRFSKDSQRMFNYWRTASTELVALAPKTPFIGPVGAFDTDADKWATANTVSHSYIEFDMTNGGAPQRQQFAGPPAGALQESLNAADDMKSIMGIYDASLGARSNETSGRAIMARQREGDVSTFNFIDNLSRAIRHTGRILADLIPKVYNAERMIRVIHENGTNEQVLINKEFQVDPSQQPQGQGDQFKKSMMQGAVDKTQDQMEFAGAITKVFDLTAGKYDVTCETGPSFTTKREEAANQMLEFVRAFPQAAPIVGDMLARNMDWPEADELSDRLKAMLPPQIMGINPQMQQLQQQMQQMDAEAKQVIGGLQQQLSAMQADKSLEAEKVNIDKYNAETNRMKLSPVESGQNIVQNDMTEAQRLQFDAEVKLELERVKHQGVMELELLKQNGAKAEAQANEAISQLSSLASQISEMNGNIKAPRRLIRDENGRPIGSTIEMAEKDDAENN
jgi:hypothetical protein